MNLSDWEWACTIAALDFNKEYVPVDTRQEYVKFIGVRQFTTEESLTRIQKRTEKNLRGDYVFRR